MIIGVIAQSGVKDTSNLFKDRIVSLGNEQNVLHDGIDIEFSGGALVDFLKFDERNLLHCKYLNLRYSSINTFNPKCLRDLMFIDLAYSQIENVSLCECL